MPQQLKLQMNLQMKRLVHAISLSSLTIMSATSLAQSPTKKPVKPSKL